MPKAPKSNDKPILIDLALQGGGSHGAFTWGVIDRLLEEPRFLVEAISGTSAGAMNAAVMMGDSSPLMMRRMRCSISSWKISRCSMTRCKASCGVILWV